MKSHTQLHLKSVRRIKQRGVVLFFALIALVVMSLAAVALIRSVDTSTMIAGNLAFKQAATSSGDIGVDAAINWLLLNKGATGLDSPTNGYYSYLAPTTTIDLTTDAPWAAITIPATTDNSGNTIQYIIQRMCRTQNGTVSTQDCLTIPISKDPGNPQSVPLPQDICNTVGCPTADSVAPQYRITARSIGPKNTVSYVQAFVY